MRPCVRLTNFCIYRLAKTGAWRVKCERWHWSNPLTRNIHLVVQFDCPCVRVCVLQVFACTDKNGGEVFHTFSFMLSPTRNGNLKEKVWKMALITPSEGCAMHFVLMGYRGGNFGHILLFSGILRVIWPEKGDGRAVQLSVRPCMRPANCCDFSLRKAIRLRTFVIGNSERNMELINSFEGSVTVHLRPRLHLHA